MGFYREKRVTTRKPHHCTGCCAGIEAGSEVTYIAGTVDGDFFSSYLCDPCKEFLDTHTNFFSEDFWCEGDIGEVRREEERSRG